MTKHAITRLFVGSRLVVLLVAGLLSSGLIGMITYLIAAPDPERPAIPTQRPLFPGARAA